MELSKKSIQVQKYLDQFGEAFEVLEMANTTRSAQDAANSIGCELGQIVKSLVFKNDDKPILFLVSGKNKLNEQIVFEHTGYQISKADAKFVKEHTGFSIGGVPPVAHKNKIETFIDMTLLEYDEIWAAAGMPFSVFKLKSSKLEKITQGKVIKTC